MFGFFAAKAIR